MKAMIVFAATAALFAAAPAAAAWEPIAKTQASVGAERATLNVDTSKLFDRIRVCILGGPVEFDKIRVNFRKGGGQNIPIRITQRGCTLSADFANGPRDIKTISLTYKEVSSALGDAIVIVYAEKE